MCCQLQIKFAVLLSHCTLAACYPVLALIHGLLSSWSTRPTIPGAWQGNHWRTSVEVSSVTGPRKAGINPHVSCSPGRCFMSWPLRCLPSRSLIPCFDSCTYLLEQVFAVRRMGENLGSGFVFPRNENSNSTSETCLLLWWLCPKSTGSPKAYMLDHLRRYKIYCQMGARIARW